MSEGDSVTSILWSLLRRFDRERGSGTMVECGVTSRANEGRATALERKRYPNAESIWIWECGRFVRERWGGTELQLVAAFSVRCVLPTSPHRFRPNPEAVARSTFAHDVAPHSMCAP